MYRVDAEEEMNKGSQLVSSSFHRHTFVTDYNLALHYIVAPLSHEDSWDFKNVATPRFCNTRTDMKGDRVNWLTTK